MENEESETRPLDPEYKEVVRRYNREWQKKSVEDGIYCVPIDQEEEDRLELEHGILSDVFRTGPFLGYDGYPDAVLDCGYGQGHWAIDVANEYADCEVIGIDIWPTVLAEDPPNMDRLCDDLNRELNVGRASFDVIQSRCVALGIHKNRWESYVGELFRLLKPGGSLQMMEYYFNFQSSTGGLQESSALFQWGQKLRQATAANRDLRIASAVAELGINSRLRQLMERAGFVNIEQRQENIPIGDWPTGFWKRGEQDVGTRNLENIDRALDSFSLWPFTEKLGMSREEVDDLNTRARAELRNPRLKAYIPLFVLLVPLVYRLHSFACIGVFADKVSTRTAIWGKRPTAGSSA